MHFSVLISCLAFCSLSCSEFEGKEAEKSGKECGCKCCSIIWRRGGSEQLIEVDRLLKSNKAWILSNLCSWSNLDLNSVSNIVDAEITNCLCICSSHITSELSFNLYAAPAVNSDLPPLFALGVSIIIPVSCAFSNSVIICNTFDWWILAGGAIEISHGIVGRRDKIYWLICCSWMPEVCNRWGRNTIRSRSSDFIVGIVTFSFGRESKGSLCQVVKTVSCRRGSITRCDRIIDLHQEYNLVLLIWVIKWGFSCISCDVKCGQRHVLPCKIVWSYKPCISSALGAVKVGVWSWIQVLCPPNPQFRVKSGVGIIVFAGWAVQEIDVRTKEWGSEMSSYALQLFICW